MHNTDTLPAFSTPHKIALALLFFVLWFGTLNVRDLIRTDETRYAEIPREMAVSGDWVTPRLSDLKYFEKPPLQYWTTAAAFTAFGQAPWTARLWTALTGALTIWLTFFTLRRVYNRSTAWAGSLILGSCIFWIGGGHINSLDMGLSFFMHSALCTLLLSQQARHQDNTRAEKNWLLACWASMALAVLSKGLIGFVLPSAVLFLYMVWTRDWALLLRLQWLRGLAVFFVITAPWFVLVSLRNPEFPEFFFIHEHFQRFLSKGHRREGPLYYFLPLLLAGFLPWTTWVVQATFSSIKQLWQHARLPWQKSSSTLTYFPSKAQGLLLIWSLFILFFFSISSSKLPGYILPIFPAFAMLAAPLLAQTSARALRAHSAAVLFISALFAAIIYWVYPQEIRKDIYYQALYAEYAQILVGCLVLQVIGSGLAIRWAQAPARLAQWGQWLGILTLAITGFVVAHGMLLGHQVLAPSSSAKVMASSVADYIEADTPLYCVDTFEHGLLFYTQRTCTLVMTKDEMYHGIAHEPQKHIPDLATFLQRWQGERKAIALVQPSRLAELEKSGIAFKVAFKDQRRILIIKESK